MKRILVAPSILSADFSRLGEEIKAVEKAGADWIHVDVMDGNFVPNITIGPLIVRDIRKNTKLTLDVHLMINRPEKYIDAFAEAGSDIITFHIEAAGNPAEVISKIRSNGKKAGVSVKPGTGLDRIEAILADVDLVLIMAVEPGFGGQEFMEDIVGKIGELRKRFKKGISVDGGVNGENSGSIIKAGANILVAGTAVFKRDDYKKAVQELRS